MLQNLSRFLVGQNGLLDRYAGYFSPGETDPGPFKSNGMSVARGEKRTSWAMRRFRCQIDWVGGEQELKDTYDLQS